MITRKPYSTDISDSQWEILKPLIPSQKPGGRPRTVNLREIINSIFYILATGCPWRLKPHDLPPWATVYDYFRIWRIEENYCLDLEVVKRNQKRVSRYYLGVGLLREHLLG